MGIDVLNLCGGQADKRGKNVFLVILPLYWAYFGQPDNHMIMNWGTSMPNTSIHPIHPRTLKLLQKILRIVGVWKWHLLCVFFVFCYSVFQKNFFCSFRGIIYFCTKNAFFICNYEKKNFIQTKNMHTTVSKLAC